MSKRSENPNGDEQPPAKKCKAEDDSKPDFTKNITEIHKRLEHCTKTQLISFVDFAKAQQHCEDIDEIKVSFLFVNLFVFLFCLFSFRFILFFFCV